MTLKVRYVCVLVAVITLIGLIAPLFSQPVFALNGFIDPNADGTVNAWSTTGGTTYSTEIDEAVRQPTVPNLTDNVSNTANNSSGLNLRMSSIAGVTTVSAVQVWIYHNDGSNGQITVQLFDDNETTARSGAQTITQSSTNAWHSTTFSGLSLTQAELNTLTVRLTVGKNGGGQPATVTVHAVYADVTYSNAVTAYEQSGFRFFNSINGTDVGTPLAGQNSSAVLNAGGDEFRLRTLVHVSAAPLGVSGETFKLQYVDRGSGSCSAPSGGTPASYTDVTTGTLIAYNNLTGGVSDGDALTANANDPTHNSDIVRNQTVEEVNNFTNSIAAVAVNEDAMWDFALIDNGAPAATTYCLRIVKASGGLLDTYTQYPAVTTGNGVLSVDIVDGAGASVPSPAFAMANSGYLFLCAQTNTLIGDASQRIEVSNFTATPSWSVSMAATAGPAVVWSDGGTNTYDFNDASGAPAGCADGGDTDGVAGQLTINPSVGTLTPRTGCTNTGVSLGSSSAYNEGATDAITLATASSSASTSCSWQITNIDASQYIPQDQAAGNYSINFTITATAI